MDTMEDAKAVTSYLKKRVRESVRVPFVKMPERVIRRWKQVQETSAVLGRSLSLEGKKPEPLSTKGVLSSDSHCSRITQGTVVRPMADEEYLREEEARAGPRHGRNFFRR